MENSRLIYIRLHGFQDQPYLYGDPGFPTALTARQVREMELPGSLVFLEGCYGYQFGRAFVDAGARAVVGCDRPTWGRRWRMGPSSVVGREWLRQIRQGRHYTRALEAALVKVPPVYRRGWAAINRRSI